MKKLLYSVIRFYPAALIALFLGVFIVLAFLSQPIVDDFQFMQLVRQYSIHDSAQFLYDNINGRLFAHYFGCTLFRLFREHESLLFIYRILMMVLFTASLTLLIRNYLNRTASKEMSYKDCITPSLFISSFYFFFFFEGRIEVWFWVSATTVHLLSLILALTGFAMLLDKRRSPIRITGILLLFTLAGSTSESYAVMYGIVLILLSLPLKKRQFPELDKTAALAGAVGVSAALIFNVVSPGIQNRFSWLPEPDLLQALKNTLHSLAFPLLRWKHLPFKIALIVLLFVLAGRSGYRMSLSRFKQGLIPVLLFITVSFFIPCYILSDIVPDRSASLGYLVGVLFLFERLFVQRKHVTEM